MSPYLLMFLVMHGYICVGKLKPGNVEEYVTVPGYGYSGEKQSLVSIGQDGEIGEQLCGSRCSLAEQCQAFFVQGQICNIVPDPGSIQRTVGQNFFVKNTEGPVPTVKVPLNEDRSEGKDGEDNRLENNEEVEEEEENKNKEKKNQGEENKTNKNKEVEKENETDKNKEEEEENETDKDKEVGEEKETDKNKKEEEENETDKNKKVEEENETDKNKEKEEENKTDKNTEVEEEKENTTSGNEEDETTTGS